MLGFDKKEYLGLEECLRCPECRTSGLETHPDLIKCVQCGAAFPIWDGIPRLLPFSMLPDLVTDYKRHLNNSGQKLRNCLPLPNSSVVESATFFRGVGGREYAETRKTVPTVRNSLKRRMEAVGDMLSAVGFSKNARLLDMGCADGKIGTYLSLRLGINDVVGMDLLDGDLLYSSHPCFQGDCHNLPFADESFDILVGAALIEHVPKPRTFLDEIHRVLTLGGVVVLTCPAPVWDLLCTVTGYFGSSNHLHRFSMRGLKSMLQQKGFGCMRGRKFMLAPLDMGFIRFLERSVLGTVLEPIMMNQVICANKVKKQ